MGQLQKNIRNRNNNRMENEYILKGIDNTY